MKSGENNNNGILFRIGGVPRKKWVAFRGTPTPQIAAASTRTEIIGQATWKSEISLYCPVFDFSLS
jgi:hypothetical protein